MLLATALPGSLLESLPGMKRDFCFHSWSCSTPCPHKTCPRNGWDPHQAECLLGAHGACAHPAVLATPDAQEALLPFCKWALKHRAVFWGNLAGTGGGWCNSFFIPHSVLVLKPSKGLSVRTGSSMQTSQGHKIKHLVLLNGASISVVLLLQESYFLPSFVSLLSLPLFLLKKSTEWLDLQMNGQGSDNRSEPELRSTGKITVINSSSRGTASVGSIAGSCRGRELGEEEWPAAEIVCPGGPRSPLEWIGKKSAVVPCPWHVRLGCRDPHLPRWAAEELILSCTKTTQCPAWAAIYGDALGSCKSPWGEDTKCATAVAPCQPASQPARARTAGKQNPPATAQPLQEELGQLGPADSLFQKFFLIKICYSLTLLGAGQWLHGWSKKWP